MLESWANRLLGFSTFYAFKGALITGVLITGALIIVGNKKRVTSNTLGNAIIWYKRIFTLRRVYPKALDVCLGDF